MEWAGPMERGHRQRWRFAFLLGLAVSGCSSGTQDPTAPLQSPGTRPSGNSPPAYEYEFRYLGASPVGDRTVHVKRVLEDRHGGASITLLKRDLGRFGSDAAVAWLTQAFHMNDLPGADELLRRVYEAGSPEPGTPILDLSLATFAVSAAVLNREIWHRKAEGPPLAGRSRGDFIRRLADLSASLADRQLEDGTWGGPVETAWALSALIDATEQSDMVKARAGERWRLAGPAILAHWTGTEDASSRSVVDRLHQAAAVRLALRISPKGSTGVPAAWFQRQFRDFDPGDDADAWFAAGLLWMVLGPSRDPDHPLQGCKSVLKDAYLDGRLRSRSPGETFALSTAIEWFGWDAFGSVMGYLRVEDWPTFEEK